MSSKVLIKFEEDTKHLYLVGERNNSKHLLGDLCYAEDGFYQFFPDLESKGGYWPTWMLRKIADKVDELNAPWEAQIAEDIGHE